MDKWSESIVIILLALAIFFVIVVPLFSPKALTEQGIKAYEKIVIAVVAILSYYLGKQHKK